MQEFHLLKGAEYLQELNQEGMLKQQEPEGKALTLPGTRTVRP